MSGVAIERVVVERDLGVEHLELAARGDDERVDFQHRHVLGDEGRVELRDQALDLLGQIAGEPERPRGRAAVVRHGAGRGIDRERMDFLRRVMRDVLDVDAAFRRKHEGDLADGAIDQRGEVELLVDRRAFLDIEPIDLLAGGSGLDGHQCRPEHLLRELPDLRDRFGEAHAALVAGRGLLELALASAARVNLALDHPERAAESLGRRLRFVGRERGAPVRHRRGECAEHRFGLIFMNVHGNELAGERRAGAKSARAAVGVTPAPG